MTTPSKLLRLARRENWAIYLLKGMSTKVGYFVRPVVPAPIYNQLRNAVEDALVTIKAEQQSRKEKR